MCEDKKDEVIGTPKSNDNSGSELQGKKRRKREREREKQRKRKKTRNLGTENHRQLFFFFGDRTQQRYDESKNGRF